MVVTGNDEISLTGDGKLQKHIVLRIDTNLKLFINHNRLHVLNQLFHFLDSLLQRSIALKLLPPSYLAQLVPCRGRR